MKNFLRMYRCLGFLWSLLDVTNMGGVKQHIVMQTPPSITPTSIFNDRSLFDQALSNGIDPHYHDRKIVYFSNDISLSMQETTDDLKSTTIVPMRSIFRATRNQFFPTYHQFSRSHYLLFTHSPYASVMDYIDFCKMEDKFAHIVNEYLDDQKTHWLILIDDPILMSNIREYGLQHTLVDQTTWITHYKNVVADMILMDLQQQDHPHL